MSTVVAFRSGFLKKAESIRLEKSREEKKENKKSNTDSNIQRPREPLMRVKHLLTEHREYKVPASVYKAWLQSGKDSRVIDTYMMSQGTWPTSPSDPDYTTWIYQIDEEEEA